MVWYHYPWCTDKEIEAPGDEIICLDSCSWNSDSPAPNPKLLTLYSLTMRHDCPSLGIPLLPLAKNFSIASRAEESGYPQVTPLPWPPLLSLRLFTCTDLRGVAKDDLSRQRSESRITAAGSGIGTVGIPWASSTGSCGEWIHGFEGPQKMQTPRWERGDGRKRRKRCLSSYKESSLVMDWKFGGESGSNSQSLRRLFPRKCPC